MLAEKEELLAVKVQLEGYVSISNLSISILENLRERDEEKQICRVSEREKAMLAETEELLAVKVQLKGYVSI